MARQRREAPVRRVNPGGKVVWRARPRDARGNRHERGTYRTKGPCGVRGSATCCAQHAIDAFYEEQDAGRLRRDTLGAYAEDWTARHPRSERTNATNDFRLGRVLDIVVEDRELRAWPLVDLRRRHTADLIGALFERGYGVEYVRGIVSVLSAMAENAIDDEIMPGNPFKGAKLRANDPRAQTEPRELRIWSVEEMHGFASCAPSPTDVASIRMLADCGFRLGEHLALRRVLQDLKTGAFKVQGTAWKGKVTPTTREKNHDRVGPIPPGCLSLLRSLPPRIDVPWLWPSPGNAHTRKPRIAWPAHADLAAELETSSYVAVARRLGVSDNALRNHMRRHAPGAELAPATGGGLWWAENWRRDVWGPTCERAGIDPTPKEFRASLNTHLLNQGINRADVADMLGHSEDVNAERYTRALRRSGDAIREAIG